MQPLYFIIVIEFVSTFANGFINTKKGCSISKTHGMRSADCFGQELTEFPKNIPSNIEIIDLGYNRIRKISKSDLSKFQSLKMLYLQDNMISKIDDSAFENLNDLTTLDVSLNGLVSLPNVVFQLPSLHNLYLSRNLNINLAETIENAKPIRSPLVRLDVSNSELETLPDLGIIPTLVVYNISGNGEIKLKPNHFAGICNLKVLDTNNVTGVFDECDCWNIETWLKERDVKFSPLHCEKPVFDCEVPVDDMHIYKNCKMIYDEMEFQSKILKIGIPVLVGVAVLILIVLYFLIRRCKRRRTKTRSKDEKLRGLIKD